MTQEELASVAGVSLGLVRDLEQGRTRSPRWAAAQALLNALGLDEQDYARLVAGEELERPRQGEWDRPGSAQPVNVQVLGPLAAERSGCFIDLGPVRRRTVLAVLALRGRAGARTGEIMDLLWPGGAPSRAANIVQGHIGQLRRLFNGRDAGARQPIAWAHGTYRLNSRLWRLDSDKFVSLSHAGDGAVAAEPDRACQLYERALRLWRGDVVADIDTLGQHPIVAELNRSRSEVILRYADAAASTGDHSVVLPHLREACRDEPLSEVLHARLIAALGALGRRSEAVRVFERLQDRLANELAIGPSDLVWRAYGDAVGL